MEIDLTKKVTLIVTPLEVQQIGYALAYYKGNANGIPNIEFWRIEAMIKKIEESAVEMDK